MNFKNSSSRFLGVTFDVAFVLQVAGFFEQLAVLFVQFFEGVLFEEIEHGRCFV